MERGRRIGRGIPGFHAWPVVRHGPLAYTLTSWGRVRQAGDPDAYVRAIVIHENSRRFRKKRVREDLRAAVPERGAAADDSLWLDMSEAATAQTLNCSVGTVKSQTSRALATLHSASPP